MKKLVLSVVVAAFAFAALGGGALQAGLPDTIHGADFPDFSRPLFSSLATTSNGSNVFGCNLWASGPGVNGSAFIFDAGLCLNDSDTWLNLIKGHGANDAGGHGAGGLFSSGVATGVAWNPSLSFNPGAFDSSMVMSATGGFGTFLTANPHPGGAKAGSFAAASSNSGDDHNVRADDFLLNTVPEPTTVALLSLSGVLFLYQIRRRK